jgi:glycosyltransferase involved in cell wall biosynthesis
MKIAITIPTYNRQEKLEKCLESIKKQTHKNIDVYVYADNNDVKTVEFIWNKALNKDEWYGKIKAIVNDKREYVVGSWNKFSSKYMNEDSIYDGMVWCVDDVELYPDCIENAVNSMLNNFPDTDGVIGFAQECPNSPNYTYKPYGQVLLGKKFIHRYKEVNFKVCCQDYIHWRQDFEMWTFASKLNKFHFNENCKLIHYHPSFIKSLMDNTHSIVRGNINKRDMELYRKRTSKGYLWGENFYLIGDTQGEQK